VAGAAPAASGGDAVGAGSEPPSGTTSRSPGWITLVNFKSFAFSSATTVTPIFSAMPLMKSPGFTSYVADESSAEAGPASATNVDTDRSAAATALADRDMPLVSAPAASDLTKT
jgi:hypothetical protein